MFSGDWLYNVTLRGCLIAGLLVLPTVLYAQHPSDAATKDVEYTQGSPAEAHAPQSKAGEPTVEQQAKSPQQPAPVENERATEPTSGANNQASEEREKKDLKAQESMAISAIDLVNLTWWQLGLGLLGMGILVYTLKLTREANKAAIRAARAADAAVEVTTNTAERQLRAYVFLEESVRTRRGSNDPWEIETHIKNFGQTPAYSASILVGTVVVDSDNFKHIELPEFPKPSLCDLAPGQVFTIRQKIPDFDDATWRAFKAYEKVILHWGRIDFIDAFRNKRWVTFRMIQTGGYVQNMIWDDNGNATSETHPN